jgi:hypothetical protein
MMELIKATKKQVSKVVRRAMLNKVGYSANSEERVNGQTK